MGFWIFMLISDLICPLVMIGFGIKFTKHPPRGINSVYGYRTALSMKNEETWKYAHEISGRIWFRSGLLLLPASVAAMLFFIGKSTDEIGAAGGIICMVQLLFLVLTVPLTERALHKRFDRNGRRRQ